jgi:hypothetical protein
VVVVCVLLAGCTPVSHSAEADVELRVLQHLDQSWSVDDDSNTRPASRPVRFSLPNGWGFLMRQCMVDAGYEAYTYDTIDGFTNGLNRVNYFGREGLAWYRCSQDLPAYFIVHTKLEDPQLDVLYHYYTTWLVPCLEAAGASITDVPSRADFGDGGEGQPGWWNPYLSASRPGSTGLVDEQFEKCEPYPQEASLTVGP